MSKNRSRRYRKKSGIGAMVTDSAAIAAKMTPQEAVLWGFFSFGGWIIAFLEFGINI